MKDHFKKACCLWYEIMNQFKKAMLKLMQLFEYEGQGHHM